MEREISYLSPSVKSLWDIFHADDFPRSLLTEFSSYDDLLSSDLIWPRGSDQNPATFYTHLAQDLSLAMMSVHIKVIGTDALARDFSWLSHPQLFDEIFQDFMHGNYGRHASLMLMCPILERSLGNILSSHAPDIPIPPLLRDLVSSKHLTDLIGKGNSVVLDLLFGSPHSVNLRNIIWHGFAQEQDIPSVFVTNIYYLCASIQNGLNDSGSIISRPFSTLTSEMDFPEESPDELMPKCPDFRRALRSQNHVMITTQLLIKMEFQLRYLFCDKNSCSQRILTAEDSRLYITFKEILASTINEEGTKNELLSFLGTNLVGLLMDLLMLPKGPRIRDRLGHGELDLSLSEDFAKWAKIVSFVVRRIDELEAGKAVTFDYRPQFHPIFIALRSIESLVRAFCDLHNFMELSLKNSSQVLDLSDEPLPDISLWKSSVLTIWQGTSLKLFDRPQVEYSVIALINRWTRSLKDLTLTLSEEVGRRATKLQSQELSFRQICSSRKLFSLFPSISHTVSESFNCLKIIMRDLQSLDATVLEKIKKIIQRTCVLTEKTAAQIDKDRYDEVKVGLTTWSSTLKAFPLSE